VEAVQTDGTSITEMQTILHTVHMFSIESLASKFDLKKTNKKKKLVTQMMEYIYEEECKK
jgi:hypothetical protein